ncbi:MAG: hypothetical protein AB1411_15595 [Nitrospirota bacterium]
MQKVIEAILQRSGYTVLTAGDATQALALALSHADPIHLLLTVPEPEGFLASDLAAELARIHGDIRILYWSGYPRELLIALDRLPPDAPFVQKGVSFHKLLQIIRETLARGGG